jgi:hypothetical protein
MPTASILVPVQRRKRGAVDCTAALLLASEMGNTLTASGPEAIAEQQKFSTLLKMLRAGLT